MREHSQRCLPDSLPNRACQLILPTLLNANPLLVLPAVAVSGRVAELGASPGNKYFVSVKVAAAGVVLSVGESPGVVGDEEEGVEDEAGGIVEELVGEADAVRLEGGRRRWEEMTRWKDHRKGREKTKKGNDGGSKGQCQALTFDEEKAPCEKLYQLRFNDGKQSECHSHVHIREPRPLHPRKKKSHVSVLVPRTTPILQINESTDLQSPIPCVPAANQYAFQLTSQANVSNPFGSCLKPNKPDQL
jgi:hypothetical protein